jgi:hypothetical protein
VSHTVVAIATVNSGIYVVCEVRAFGKGRVFIIETECFRCRVRGEAEEKF